MVLVVALRCLFVFLLANVLCAPLWGDDQSSLRAAFAENLNLWLAAKCKPKLLSMANFPENAKDPMWIIAFVRFEKGEVSIRASVAANLEKIEPGATLLSVNETARIEVNQLVWKKEGDRLEVYGDCQYAEFGDDPKLTGKSSTRIKIFLLPSQAIVLSAVNYGRALDVAGATGTGIVALRP